MTATAHDRLGSIAAAPPTDRPANTPPKSPDDAPHSPQQDMRADGGVGEGLQIERRKQQAPGLDVNREVPLWDRDDAPAGSTSSSLLVFEDGVPTRISGPTHYTHLATGEIVGGFGVGTHVDNGDRIVPILAHYEG